MLLNKSTFLRKYLDHYSGVSNQCWRGIMVSFLDSTLMAVFYFLSIYFVKVLNINISTASTIISFYGLGAVLGSYLSGKLSDKISPLKVSIISLLIQSIGYLALIKIKSVYLLACNVFILGISTYGFITSNHVWILNQCKFDESQRIKAINLLSTASNLGLGLSGILIGALSKYGFINIFILSSLLIMILAFFLIYQITVTESTNHEINLTRELVTNKKSYDEKKVLWLVLTCVLFIGCIVSQMSSTYTIFIQNTFPQMGMKATSILFSLNSFLVVILATPLGNAIKNYNKILMVGIGGFLIGIGMLLLSVSSIFILAILSCVIYTTGEIIFFCMAQFLCYQKGSAKQKGKSLGMFRMVYASSRVIGPTAGGHLFHYFGGNLIWYLSGIIGLLCLISCNLLKHDS